MAKTLIKVVVRDTESILFSGDVDRISSYNEVGPFDVYPMHANFISIIRQQLALYNDHKMVKELKIEQAVMKVKKDIVNIFLGIEVLTLEEISESATPVKKKQPTPETPPTSQK